MKKKKKEPWIGTSLAVQRLRLCFHCRGHEFDLWLGKWDPARLTVQPNNNNNNSTDEVFNAIFCDDAEMISLEYVNLLATLIVVIMITCREFILNLHILEMNFLYLYSLFIYNRHHKMLILYLLAWGTFQCGLALLLSLSSKDSPCIKRQKAWLTGDSGGREIYSTLWHSLLLWLY